MQDPNSPHIQPRPVTRREALRIVGGGFGMVGLAGTLGTLDAAGVQPAASPMAPKAPQFPAKAKRIIYIFLSGGMSHIDTFDRKPTLDKYDGKPMPYATPVTQFATGNLMRSPFQFQQYGQNGL